MTPNQVSKKYLKLTAKSDAVFKEIKELQKSCAHPNVKVTSGSDTGNWCSADDCYWEDFVCPDCGKRWTHYKSPFA